MGDPKKLRKKYQPPKHPWEASRIIAEKPLMQEYGLKNKKEIWKARSLLRKFTHQAKILSTIKNRHEEIELKQLLDKLIKLGLLQQGQDRENILDLNLRNILDRRLQTLIVKRGLAKTAKQSRQLIVHGHISVNGQKVTVPNYLVSVNEQDKISYLPKSSFNNLEHSERILIEAKNKKTKEEKEIKESKNKKFEENKKAEKSKEENKAEEVKEAKEAEEAKKE